MPSELRILINATKAVAQTLQKDVVSEQDVSKSLIRSGGWGGNNFSRLPEIPLPKFNGEFHRWPTFRDRFIALVEGRPGLSNVDKLYYLTGCLQGVALDAIRGIPVSEQNYELAWSTLATRFYRPRMVATSLVDKLLVVPTSSQESLHDLTVFLATFEESISLLSSLNIPDLGSFILFTLAFRNLSVVTRKLFESSISGVSTYPSIDDLLKFIRTRITVLENVSEIKGTVNRKSNQNSISVVSGFGKGRPGKEHPVSLVTTKSVSSSVLSCLRCSGPHNISSCSQFRSGSIDDRNRFAHDHKLCFNCLSGSHWSRACPSKARCQTCSGKHHSLLHGVTPARKEKVAEGVGSRNFFVRSGGVYPINITVTSPFGYRFDTRP